ncbi:hypothetical protein [Komagataeibacter sp. SM21]
MVQLLTSLVKLYGGTEDRIDRAMERYLTDGAVPASSACLYRDRYDPTK